MAIERITVPLLDVLEVLLDDLATGQGELHGWAIMRATHHTGPTVYGVLDRLEDAGWIVGRWEDVPPDVGRPRRRLYTLTPTGSNSARQVLAQRRPSRAARQPLSQKTLGWAMHAVFSIPFEGGVR